MWGIFLHAVSRMWYKFGMATPFMTTANQPLRVLLSTSMSKAGFFISPPMGLVRLQYYLQERGIECDIMDLDLNDQPDYPGRVECGYYDIVGFSVSHYNVECDLDMLWRMRRGVRSCGKRCLFVGGGQEATMNYEQWLDMGIDVVLTGFAERWLYELCVRFAKTRADDPWHTVVDGLHGCAVRLPDGRAHYTPNPALTIEDFQDLSYTQLMRLHMPYQAYWDQVRSEIGSTNFHKNKFTVECARLFTSSHCPRGCGFCSSQTFVKASQGGKSPIIMLTAQQVTDLLVHYSQVYGARSFLFSDDDYLVGSRPGLERAFAISQMIIAARAKGLITDDAHFSCQTRVVNFLSRSGGVAAPHWEFIESLHAAGFHSVGLGVETFSERLMRLPSVNKVGVTVADCRMAIDALLAKGLLPQINLILAIPESTVDELMQTMHAGAEYIRKGCQVAVTVLMKAIPGAPMLLCGDYRHSTIDWKNPETNQTVKIAHYFLPNDPQIADIVHDIEPATLVELQRWKDNSPWQGGTTPKFLYGLAAFIAVSELLQRPADAAYFREVTGEIITEVNTLAVI